MLTIAETLQVANMSIPLAINANARGGLFGKKLTSPTSPLTIQMAHDGLSWGNSGGQDAEDLRNLANYLYWLCGKYGLQAQYIIGLANGGGSVVPGGGFTAPSRQDFIVSASSFLPTGTASYTFPTTWAGRNMDFVRNGIPQSTVTTEVSYFTWDRTTRAFTVSPALTADELISIIPS